MILPTLSACRHSLPPHLETTVSQKKQLTWGELGVYTFFEFQLIWIFRFCAMSGS